MNNKCVFVHIPKTGGASVFEWADRAGFDRVWVDDYKNLGAALLSDNNWVQGHFSVRDVFKAEKETGVGKSKFMYTMLRNPLDRVLSNSKFSGLEVSEIMSNTQTKYICRTKDDMKRDIDFYDYDTARTILREDIYAGVTERHKQFTDHLEGYLPEYYDIDPVGDVHIKETGRKETCNEENEIIEKILADNRYDMDLYNRGVSWSP